VISVPALSAAFGTYPLTGADWLVVTAAAASVVPVLDLTKWQIRRYAGDQKAAMNCSTKRS
jgi:P-type Ca2+ transporter type 2C